MTTNTTEPNPTHSPREHILEHIFEVIRDTDHGDDYQTATDLLKWIEERTLGKDVDGSLKFVNPDHPVTFLEPGSTPAPEVAIDDLDDDDRAYVRGVWA